MKISGATIAKYVGATVHYLGPTITLGIVAVFGFGVLSARLESQQKKLYVATQNQVAQFRVLADGIAQAKTKVVEKRTLQKTVKELPPEVRKELKDLKAKVAALLKAQIVIPEHSGSGNATHEKPLQWTFEKPDYLSVKFTLKASPDANMKAIPNIPGQFDYTIAPVPIELDMTKGVFKRNGVDGLQQWFITAKDTRDNTPLKVKSFDVRISNMFEKKHWWQKWYIVGPGTLLLTAAATK